MMRLVLPSRSLGSKLIVMFVAGAIMPLVILTFINTSLSGNTMLTIARGRIHAQANAAIYRIETYLAERQTDARVIASLPVSRNLAAGNLHSRLHMKQCDEIGELATSFNTMAETIEARIAAEQAAQQQAHALQHAEQENRRHLEETIRHYLAFVQHVAQGNLTQRLVLTTTGMLGELGDGLNHMGERLHHMTYRILEASNNILNTTATILDATAQQTARANEQSTQHATRQTLSTAGQQNEQHKHCTRSHNRYSMRFQCIPFEKPTTRITRDDGIKQTRHEEDVVVE